MDVFSKKKRSEVMSKIKGKDTQIEILIRKLLFSKGYRFRKNVKNLPGTPDIVLKKYNTIIFINGCFWHGHTPCRRFNLPKTRANYWKNKILGNKKRDCKNKRLLLRAGWKVISLWECKLIKDAEKQMKRLEYIIQK